MLGEYCETQQGASSQTNFSNLKVRNSSMAAHVEEDYSNTHAFFGSVYLFCHSTLVVLRSISQIPLPPGEGEKEDMSSEAS